MAVERTIQESISTSGIRVSIGLLLSRRFGTFWFASLLSNIGTWAQQVAQPWLLLSLGASSFVIGLDAFALNAPVLLLTLVGGVLADHADRRKIIARFQSAQMLCPIILVALLLAGSTRPWMVVSLSVVVGVTDALSMPSFQSIVPSIVRHDQIASGLALNSTQFNLSRILGPALAGVMLAGAGAMACFAVSAISYVPFILVAVWILPGRVGPPSVLGAGGYRQIYAGVFKIARIPYFSGALLTVFLSSLLCAQIVTFCPVLIKDVFHGSAGDFSLAISAFGAGGLLGAFGLLFVSASTDRRMLTSCFAGVYGLILVLVGLNPWLRILPLLLGLCGAAMSVSSIASNTLIQANAPVALRGESVSLYMLAMRGGLAIGSLLTGASVNFFGVAHALLINGAVAVVAQILVGRYWQRAKLPIAAAGDAS